MPEGLVWVWDAFHELHTCRPIGMSLGPIPWTAINEYGRAREVIDAARFERLIRALDGAFLGQLYQEREQGKEKRPSG